MDWSAYPNFEEHEFRCRHCGKANMVPEFMERLQALRTIYGRSLTVSSGYRCENHPVEKAKPSPGMHATGKAADLAVVGGDALDVLKIALDLGFKGVGVQQKGNGRFIHLDMREQPAIWSY